MFECEYILILNVCVLKQDNQCACGILMFYRVERIVGSSSNSSELNDSGDQAPDNQQQEAEETTKLICKKSRKQHHKKFSLKNSGKDVCSSP